MPNAGRRRANSFTRTCCALRRAEIVPRLDGARAVDARAVGAAAVIAHLADGRQLASDHRQQSRADGGADAAAARACSCSPAPKRRRGGATGPDRTIFHRRGAGTAMNDAAVRELAAPRRHRGRVERLCRTNRIAYRPKSLRRILAALGFPATRDADVAHSRRSLATVAAAAADHRDGRRADRSAGCRSSPGSACRSLTRTARCGASSCAARSAACELPGIETPGYHTLEIGAERITLAVAPPRCVTSRTLRRASARGGLPRKLYGLRRAGDCGIGDMAGVVALAERRRPLEGRRAGAQPDARAVCGRSQPFQPLFAVEPAVLQSAPCRSRDRCSATRAWRKRQPTPASAARAAELEQQRPDRLAASPPTPRWRFSARSVRGFLVDRSRRTAATPTCRGLCAISRGRAERCSKITRVSKRCMRRRLLPIRRHGTGAIGRKQWRDPHSADVTRLCGRRMRREVAVPLLSAMDRRSLLCRRAAARQNEAGMRIGLIADLAVGMSSAGSHAWTNQNDILGGLEIGAPPDLFNRQRPELGADHVLAARARRRRLCALHRHHCAPACGMPAACASTTPWA